MLGSITSCSHFKTVQYITLPGVIIKFSSYTHNMPLTPGYKNLKYMRHNNKIII